jgi:hypothetical protein
MAPISPDRALNRGHQRHANARDRVSETRSVVAPFALDLTKVVGTDS